MTDDDVRQAFSGFDPSKYEDEVRDRWSDTDAHAESRRRTSSHTEQDWQRHRKETDDNVAFYPLTPEAHVGLARSYVTDARFDANDEKSATGLTRYISDSITALHADRRSGKPASEAHHRLPSRARSPDRRSPATIPAADPGSRVDVRLNAGDPAQTRTDR